MALFVPVLLLEVFEHFSHKVTMMSEHNTSSPADLSTLLDLQNILTEVITNHPEETEAASSTRAERHQEFSKIITKLETNNQAHLSIVGEFETLLEASQALDLGTRAVLQSRFTQLTNELGSHGMFIGEVGDDFGSYFASCNSQAEQDHRHTLWQSKDGSEHLKMIADCLNESYDKVHATVAARSTLDCIKTVKNVFAYDKQVQDWCLTLQNIHKDARAEAKVQVAGQEPEQ